MFYYFTYRTVFGIGAIIYSKRGIKYHLLPEKAESKLIERIERAAPIGMKINVKLKNSLERYFAGEKVNWPVELDLGDFSDFTRKVYLATLNIDYGRRASYKQVAILAGCPDGQRAAGGALKRNPLPIFIPCHRVISASGGIGGWSGPPGWKERLLEIESGVES